MARELLVRESFQNPEIYEAHSETEVRKALADLGYGLSKMYVDSIYVCPPNGWLGVGVLTVKAEHCLDHFGLFRGVDQAEAIAQTGILAAKFSNQIPKGQRPLLTKIEGFEYDFPVVEGAVLNLLVKMGNSYSGGLSIEGQVLVGKTVVADGIIEGKMADERAIGVLIARRKQIQARTQPLFPPID